MVVSLTIIPVLAARFLARRADADDRPDLQPAGRRLRRAAQGRPPVPAISVLLRPVDGDSRLVAVSRTWKPGFMPDMDEGAFVLDYNMPVGTSLGSDRQGHAPGRGRALQNARHLGLHPPDRGRTRLLRHRTAYRRHSRQPQAGRRTPADAGDLRRLAKRSSRPRSPSCETEFVPLVPDQINDLAGVDKPIEVKVFGPDFNETPRAGRAGREDRRERFRALATVNAHVYLGNPDIVIRPDSCQDGAGRARPSWTSRRSSTPRSTARWPARSPSRTG